MQNHTLPFDDIKDLVEKMPQPDLHKIDSLFSNKRPLIFHDNLDVFQAVLHHLSSYQEKYPPTLDKITMALFIGSHGVAPHDNTMPDKLTIHNLLNAFKSGETPLNRLCSQQDAELKVFEVGLDIPTENVSQEDAMSEKETVSTIAYGMEALAQKSDILVLSSLGEGGNLIATILASHLINEPTDQWISTDLFPLYHEETLKNIFNKTAQRIAGDKDEPLDLLRRIGGREIAAIMGAIIAGRYQKTPVILDSLSSLVSALMIKSMNLGTIDHCLLGHFSTNPVFIKIADYLGLKPLINMDFPIDGGIGGISSVGLLKSALIAHMA